MKGAETLAEAGTRCLGYLPDKRIDLGNKYWEVVYIRQNTEDIIAALNAIEELHSRLDLEGFCLRCRRKHPCPTLQFARYGVKEE